jgi:photosystem II stability/assembly factor-like uncharacterized protein
MGEIPDVKREARSALYRTEDGGATWVSVAEVNEGHIWGFVVARPDHILLFGQNGSLYKLAGFNGRLQKLRSGTSLGIADVCVRGSIGLAVGSSGSAQTLRDSLILVSSDGGEIWRRVKSPIKDTFSGVYLSTWERGILVGTKAIYQFRLHRGN